jgi:hypothetical protein
VLRRLVLGVLVALLVAAPASASVDELCPKGERCRDYGALASLVDIELLPVPDGQPGPLVQPAGGWSQFGRSQPPTPVWNPPGPKRVGLQAGHFEHGDAPAELSSLRRNPGAPGGGRVEWQVTIEVARLAARMLEERGYEVDVLPTTIPVRYRAHAFASIHVDGSENQGLRGYKLARPNFSSIPEVDDRFLEIAHAAYGQVTGLPDNSDYVTGRMRNYYAFNARRYRHAVAPGVPQLIYETGFMSNWADRQFLFDTPEVAAQGIVEGVVRFLELDAR